MPVRDWKFRITDILEAIQDSLEMTRAMDYGTFSQDKRTLKAVLYNLAVIGEAPGVPEGSPPVSGDSWRWATW
jgi:uncharacterized protein with HEPN domain